MYSLITTTFPYIVFFGGVYFYLKHKYKEREAEERKLIELMELQEKVRGLSAYTGYNEFIQEDEADGNAAG